MKWNCSFETLTPNERWCCTFGFHMDVFIPKYIVAGFHKAREDVQGAEVQELKFRESLRLTALPPWSRGLEHRAVLQPMLAQNFKQPFHLPIKGSCRHYGY